MNTRYQQGRALEWKVRDILAASGYLVFRSAGSKSVADLIAFPDRDMDPMLSGAPEWALRWPLMVQCKRGGVLPPGEWNELFSAALSASAVPIMARYTPRSPIEFFRLTGRKLGRGRQPMEPVVFGATLTYPDGDVTIG